MQKIQRVTITLDSGREVVVEGIGYASLRTTKGGNRTEVVADLEVHMPVEAEWAQGEGGRYIKTAVNL